VLDLWKAAWDGLIWKALISKAKATERELNRNLLLLSGGDLRLYFPLHYLWQCDIDIIARFFKGAMMLYIVPYMIRVVLSLAQASYYIK